VLGFLTVLAVILLLFTGEMHQVTPDKTLLLMRILLYLLIILAGLSTPGMKTAGKYFLITAIPAS